MSPSETASAPANSLAYIPLDFDALTQDQVRGITCAWCGAALNAETAVDLGERRLRRPGENVAWFPRGCRQCAMVQAMVALKGHSDSCEQCIDDYTRCETGLGLVRAVRDARR
jgi:hypothetical protein